MSGKRAEPKRPAVVLLDADPDLAAGLDPTDLQAARRLAVAAIMDLTTSGWDLDEVRRTATDGWLGLLVVHGLMIRRVTVGKRAACELFGPGDLVRPWDSDGEYAPLTISVDWQVLKPTRLAVLDTAFALRVARWPSITSRIVGRVAQRARYLALTQAVTHLPRGLCPAPDSVLAAGRALGERQSRGGLHHPAPHPRDSGHARGGSSSSSDDRVATPVTGRAAHPRAVGPVAAHESRHPASR